MIKRPIAIICMCVMLLGMVQAQDIRTLFINMPDSIMPALTKSERMDFLDYMDSEMLPRVSNKLGGVRQYGNGTVST